MKEAGHHPLAPLPALSTRSGSAPSPPTTARWHTPTSSPTLSPWPLTITPTRRPKLPTPLPSPPSHPHLPPPPPLLTQREEKTNHKREKTGGTSSAERPRHRHTLSRRSILVLGTRLNTHREAARGARMNKVPFNPTPIRHTPSYPFHCSEAQDLARALGNELVLTITRGAFFSHHCLLQHSKTGVASPTGCGGVCHLAEARRTADWGFPLHRHVIYLGGRWGECGRARRQCPAVTS